MLLSSMAHDKHDILEAFPSDAAGYDRLTTITSDRMLADRELATAYRQAPDNVIVSGTQVYFLLSRLSYFPILALGCVNHGSRRSRFRT